MKIELKCKVCGKIYSSFPSELKAGQRKNYCSAKCSSRARKLKLYRMRGPHKKGKFIKCLMCDKIIWAEPNQIKKGKKYCSIQCLGIANGNRTRGKRNPLAGKPPVINICKICNKEFSFYQCKAKREGDRGYCCSRKCADKWHSFQLRGEKSHFWKGGTTSLQMIIRNSTQAKRYRLCVFERDNWTSILSGKNGDVEHHHLVALSILIKRHNITKENWRCLKDVLFKLNNAVTITEKEHDKFHGLYGKMTTPEQFEEFRNLGGL